MPRPRKPDKGIKLQLYLPSETLHQLKNIQEELKLETIQKVIYRFIEIGLQARRSLQS